MDNIVEFIGGFITNHEKGFNLCLWLGIIVFAIGCYFFRWWFARFIGEISGYRED